MTGRAFVMLQYLLPRHLMTAAVYRLARVRIRFVKDALIRAFVRLFDVDLDEVDAKVPDDFRTFNDFFTRELADDARPVDPGPDTIVSPVDGTVSAAARLRSDIILQAKGIDYTLDDLLALDIDDARRYANGASATIYLAPHNYHRVHMPFDGELVAANYIPGDLFSVNGATVSRLRNLFARNERLNLHFETPRGPAAVILVGALNVGSITTPWTGEIRPRKHGVAEPQILDGAPRALEKGDLLGWFNLGSTVIVLLPEGVSAWHPSLAAGASLRMGEPIGTFTAGAA